jgi:hypothetical protein
MNEIEIGLAGRDDREYGGRFRIRTLQFDQGKFHFLLERAGSEPRALDQATLVLSANLVGEMTRSLVRYATQASWTLSELGIEVGSSTDKPDNDENSN